MCIHPRRTASICKSVLKCTRLSNRCVFDFRYLTSSSRVTCTLVRARDPKKVSGELRLLTGNLASTDVEGDRGTSFNGVIYQSLMYAPMYKRVTTPLTPADPFRIRDAAQVTSTLSESIRQLHALLRESH